jgi:DNA topoisomerase-1
MDIVLVESYTKTKTIETILNQHFQTKFKVFATGGHWDNLVKKRLGIDIQNNFEPEYEILKDKIKTINFIKQCKYNKLWIATDKDFEGEKIAESIIHILNKTKYNRVYFTEITKSSIIDAFQNPHSKLNQAYLDCQFTRRIMDRLLGYKITPFLWKLQKKNLSMGRVQSACLLLIENNEKEIHKFQSQFYWECYANYSSSIISTLYTENHIHKFENESIGIQFIENISNEFHMECKPLQQEFDSPLKPYVTSSLQQDAYVKLHMNVKKTMFIAQELYEKGKITYPRTDSVSISNDFIVQLQDYIQKKYPSYFYINKSIKNKLNAQLAHEAIRPTMIDIENCEDLSTDCQKLYKMIWMRTVAFYLKPAIYEILEIHFIHSGFKENQYFVSKIKKLKYNGYLILKNIKSDNYDWKNIKDEYHNLNVMTIQLEPKMTNAPCSFDEASLIRTMERMGIGRPATFQITIDKLITKHLIEKVNILSKSFSCYSYQWDLKHLQKKEKNIIVSAQNQKFQLTSDGWFILNFIHNYLSSILNIETTKYIETQIDNILHSKSDKLTILNEFYQQFISVLENIQLPTMIENKNNLVKNGKFGNYITFENKNISIEMYLKLMNKKVSEFTQEDFNFLTQFPILYQNDKICYGRYGFYYKNKKQSIDIHLLKQILNF